jgi:alkylation response protein AidB-like acyl-CoA dehydrogenase
MNELDELFIRTEQQHQLVSKVNRLAEEFVKRADENDRKASFPFENFRDLKRAGLASLTVPKMYGGMEIPLYDFLLVQEMIARGDGATALSFGWHLGIMMDLSTRRPWKEDTFRALCSEVVHEQKLMNNASSESGTGSPTRGGKPQTAACKKGETWILNGRKTFTSLAPMLDYFVVSATVIDTEEVGNFLVPRETQGVSIEGTWDTVGMRGTRSDDLILQNVVLVEEALVSYKEAGVKPAPQGWLLHIPACYIGIAMAARNEAIRFAREYRPNSLPGPIKDVPEVRRKIGEIDIELTAARHLMYSVAEKWDTHVDLRSKMGPELATVKYVVTNAAIRIVDLAMRVVGGQSLFSTNPLQRYYRDIRAGLHNPPADDITVSMMARRALSE